MAASVIKVRGVLSLPVLALLLILQTHHARADFGLPMVLPNGFQIIGSANGINGALNALSKASQNLNSAGRTERMILAMQALDQVTKNVTMIGRLLAGSVIKAVSDRTTPSNELFPKLQESYGLLSEYLTVNVTETMQVLNSSVGNDQTLKLKDALHAVHGAVSNVSDIISNMHSGIAKAIISSEGSQLTKAAVSANVPSTLTASLSKTLGQTKDQLTALTKTVESIMRNIVQASAYLAKYNQLKQAVEKNIITAHQNIASITTSEREAIVKKYLAIRNGIITDLSGAVAKLEVFSPNRTLLSLYDKHSEEYTKIYYFLFNRNETDILNISSVYDSIGANLGQMVLESSASFGNSSQSLATQLTDMLIEQGGNGAICYNKYSSQLLNAYPNFQNSIGNCINREKNRIARITEVIDRMLLLVAANGQDFAANVASCSALQGFTNSEYVYAQAAACLTTNVNEMPLFPAIIGAELDVINQMGTVEIAASKYRLFDCIASRNNEALANLYILNRDIGRCMSDDQARLDDSEYSTYELTTEHFEESTDYDYLIEVEAQTNYTDWQDVV